MTEQALLSAILEHPDDDAPRLAYADWLADHGQPERAEFIRAQCGLATGNIGDGRESQMERRGYELRKKYGEAWASDLLVRGVYKVTFERGFVEEMTATAHAFIRHGRRWVERTPLRELTLLRVAGQVERLAARAYLRGVRSLFIHDSQVGDRDIQTIAASPYLQGLGVLGIRGNSYMGKGTHVGDTGLHALTNAAFFEQLTSLTIISNSRLGTPGVLALVERAKEPQLEELHLAHGSIDDGGARALAEADGLSSLEGLSLEGHDIGDDGLAALLTSTSLTSLTRLWLRGNRITGSGLASVAGASCPPALEWLNLECNPVDTVDLDALAELLRNNPQLRVSLQGCPLPKEVQWDMLPLFPRVGVDERPRPKHTAQIMG